MEYQYAYIALISEYYDNPVADWFEKSLDIGIDYTIEKVYYSLTRRFLYYFIILNEETKHLYVLAWNDIIRLD